MRTIRTKVYKFSELKTKEARQKAIDWYKKTLDDDPEILFGFEDYCSERAKEAGFNDIKVQYSLSCCQGDGLSFSGEIDLKRVIPEILPGIKKSVLNALVNNCSYTLKGNDGRYCFASKSDIDLWLDNYTSNDKPNIQKLIDKILPALENRYMTLCKELESEGYKWIESAYEDENIIENIEANEYEFTADGRRF